MSSPRTNNYLEGWHNKLKQIARKAHPSVFKLVEIFKKSKKSVDKDKKIGELDL